MEMSKPAALLIGGVTHVQKEWEECATFAELKVNFSVVQLGFAIVMKNGADQLL